MKIYTREKKPNLYGLLIVSAVCLVLAGVMYFLRDRTGIWSAGSLAVFMAAFYLSAVVFLLVTLKNQLAYNPYSYNTIYYSGFSLFATSVFVSQAVTAFECVTGVGTFGFAEAGEMMVSSAKNYMGLSLPFIAVFSAALIVSNIRLMQREGYRVQNVLGILLAVCLLGGEAVVYFLGHKKGVVGFFIGLFSYAYIYVECMIIGAIFANVFAVRHRPAYDKDYIIILGCRVKKDGTPTPLLRGRADAALEFSKQQLQKTGKKARFISSGGKGKDEPISEAECICNYLLSRGVDRDDIILEDKSRNTLENMQFSFALTEKDARCVFATTNFHVFRSGIWSNRAEKHKAEGIGAPTKWYFWPNAAVREYVGLLTGHSGKQIIIILALIALYVASFVVGYK